MIMNIQSAFSYMKKSNLRLKFLMKSATKNLVGLFGGKFGGFASLKCN